LPFLANESVPANVTTPADFEASVQAFAKVPPPTAPSKRPVPPTAESPSLPVAVK
jgi:hypothetical protein